VAMCQGKERPRLSTRQVESRVEFAGVSLRKSYLFPEDGFSGGEPTGFGITLKKL